MEQEEGTPRRKLFWSCFESSLRASMLAQKILRAKSKENIVGMLVYYALYIHTNTSCKSNKDDPLLRNLILDDFLLFFGDIFELFFHLIKFDCAQVGFRFGLFVLSMD